MKKSLFIIVALATICSCAGNIDKKASRFLDAAQSCFEHGDFQSAKLYIDSVREVYPKAFETRKKGIRLMQQVELAEAERTVAYQDSVQRIMLAQFEEVKSGFVFEKDEKYQDMGLYTKASQALEKNPGRNYLRAQVDEQGHFTIVSNYSGSSYIHHRSLRLSVGSDFAETPVSDDYYEFSDLGICYEKCNFHAGRDGDIAAFVSLNRNEDIDVMLKGEKTIRAKMTAADKEAISELYSLSLLLTSITESKALEDEALRKIRFVNENIARTESDSVAQL